MRIKLAFLFLASVTTGACSYTPGEPVPQRGIIPVNVPVVSRADYSFDAMTQGGQLPPTETARLDGWFRGLGLGYGDAIFVDGPMAEAARSDVAGIAGRYGLMLSAGAPVTVGAIMDGSVRVVVSRTRASPTGASRRARPTRTRCLPTSVAGSTRTWPRWSRTPRTWSTGATEAAFRMRRSRAVPSKCIEPPRRPAKRASNKSAPPQAEAASNERPLPSARRDS